MIREYVTLFCESKEFRPESVNYTECPECGHAKKLMIVPLDDGGVFWRCLRASCPTHGVVGGVRQVRADQGIRKVRQVVPRLVTSPMTAERAGWLETQHVSGFRCFPNLGAVNLAMAEGPDDSIVYHIRSRLGEHRGDVQRWYDGRKDKAKTHAYTAEGALVHWQTNPGATSSTLVIVEDIPSALTLAYSTGVKYVMALCGSGMSRDAAREIIAAKPNSVLFCLDGDATDQAARLRHQWGGVLGCSTRVVPLDLDIKDMQPEEVRDWWEAVR